MCVCVFLPVCMCVCVVGACVRGIISIYMAVGVLHTFI